MKMSDLELISAAELDRYVGRKEYLLIDLRDRKEFEKAHILSAENYPFTHLSEHVCLPRNRILILYCERGSSSMTEAKLLQEEGYRVKSVIGGIHAYRGKYLIRCIPRAENQREKRL